jgi:hypothetical protein
MGFGERVIEIVDWVGDVNGGIRFGQTTTFGASCI